MATLLYVILAIVIFGVIIAIHELGHFITARLCGVNVLEFAIGMGPVIWSGDSKSGTKISLRCLPIGGFCALEGEDQSSDDPCAFTNAAPWKRFLILVAGSFMNFVLGFVLVVVCMTQVYGFVSPTITSFMDGCPYEGTDGLMVGDTIYKINGSRVYFVSDVSGYLQAGGDYADIVVIRDGEKVTLSNYHITLQDYIDEDTGETVSRYGLYFESIETGALAKLRYSWYYSMDFVKMVWEGLESLISGAIGIDQMSGVVGIVDTMAEVGTESATTYDAILNITYLAAFIAINLAVMNLLPIPAVDGGRIFLLIVTCILEKILRRKIDPKYEAYIHAMGMMLLMALMAFLVYNDIARIITG